MAPALIPEYLKARIRELPDKSGVYLFKNKESRPVYIGKALSIRKRVMSHFRYFNESFSKEGIMLGEVRSIDFLETPTEAEALLLESSLVKQHLPRYNIELRDDKSYPYIKITGEEFPRLLVVRGRKADGGKYFGPYTSGLLLKKAVKMLRRLFPMRTCHPMPEKLCLMYHIGQCKGPCTGEINKTDYMKIVKDLEHFLEGRKDAMVRILSRQMKEYSKNQEYEKAQIVYQEIQALAMLPEGRPILKEGTHVLDLLQKALSLPRRPNRMECFDISNISGKEAVGSMVVFENAEAHRAEYRRFRIKTVQGIDDYKMMKEVIRRRYTRVLEEKQSLPDLVVIDGGKGHLGAAKSELDALGLQDQPIVSIAKQHEHLFLPGNPQPFIFPQSSPILHLMQRLRDEAHRFAITYHRMLHRKEAVISQLDEIAGVGPKTREILLKRVGSVKKIRQSSPEDISRKAGISIKKAQEILLKLNTEVPDVKKDQNPRFRRKSASGLVQ